MVFRGQDAWRKHPLLAGAYKAPFPGLKMATGIFAAYLVIDTLFSAAGSSNHGHGHGHESHKHGAQGQPKYEFEELDKVPRLAK